MRWTVRAPGRGARVIDTSQLARKAVCNTLSQQPMKRLRFSALAALAGMLFLQAAIAFAPCEMPENAGMAAMQAEAMPDCHEQADDAPNLCLAHCQSQDQTLSKLQPQLPDLAQPQSVIIAWQPSRPAHVPAVRVVPLAAPPPRILFQSFLL